MNQFLGEFLGSVGAICIAFCFLPQTIEILKTKNVEGISLLSYTIYNIGIISFILYGFYLGSLQIILSNSFLEIFAFLILFTTIKFRKNIKKQ